MTTLHPTDSIFWEEYGGSVTETFAHMIPDAQMLREASEFAGTIPVKQLLPFWKTGKRYLYTGGSVQMRDAAIFVRENSWDRAFELWEQVYNGTKKEKKKMKAALNGTMLPSGIRLFGKTDKRLYSFGNFPVRRKYRADNVVAVFILPVDIDGLQVGTQQQRLRRESE